MDPRWSSFIFRSSTMGYLSTLTNMVMFFGLQLTCINCECPGDGNFEEIGGSCYYFSFKPQHNQALNWAGAKSFCQGLGSQVGGLRVALAEVGGSESWLTDSLMLNEISKNEGLTWLGASDSDIEGSWKWDTSGRNLPLFDPIWRDHQPNFSNSSDTGDCLVAYRGGVYLRVNIGDWNCTAELAFVCQIMKEEKTTSSITLDKGICPDDLWDWVDGNCYYFSSDDAGRQAANWTVAKSSCHIMGTAEEDVRLAELGNPTNLKTDEWLMEMIKAKGHEVWLGAFDRTEGNDWVWLSGRPLSINSPYWAPDQPNNHNGTAQHCLNTIKEGDKDPKRQYFNDGDCNQVYNYVCQLFKPKNV